jgi:hypothetical protein
MDTTLSVTSPGSAPGSGDGCRSLLFLDFLQHGHHLGPKRPARFLLLSRQPGDGFRVWDSGEFGVLLPVLERLADAGVFPGVLGDLSPAGEFGAEGCTRRTGPADWTMHTIGSPYAPTPGYAAFFI